MNIKQILIAATPLITLALGYFGYEPIQELKSPTVNLDIQIPEHPENTHDTYHEHKSKDWLPVIRNELEKARAEHNEIHH